MKEEQLLALCLLAGIDASKRYRIVNEYWGSVSEWGRDNPWWLVKTPRGMLKIGWRKRVINIDWSDTDIRSWTTKDDVTKGDAMVHAWGYIKALEYLTSLAPVLAADLANSPCG